MTDKKFSSGPWRIITNIDKRKNPCGYAVMNYERLICNTPDGYGKQSENYYNVKLIAAAPELLEACENALQFVKNVQGRFPDFGPGRVGQDTEEKLFEAIKKALITE